MTPAALVAAYAREAAPLERRGDGGPEQLPSGAAILALDAHGRAAAVVAAYDALPKAGAWGKGSYGRNIMLGLLITHLLRKRLPLTDKGLEAMAEGAATAHGAGWGPIDFDMALVKELARRERVSPKVKASLRKLAARRGTDAAVDRRIAAACEELASR
jgi:hypothetical protein